ncbi:MAG TPA: phosphate ABC transporter permease subunit PstC [Aggregatilineales bacterium]|nr:phosphate ABC transporter permease subunit PstC [Aggregatilineales bacterium]
MAAAQQLASRERGDQIFGFVLRLCALIAIVILVGIVILLVINSTPTFQKFGLNFFTGSLWDPAPPETLGVLSFIYGTVATSIIALIVAMPLALGGALFVSEYAPRWLGTPVAFIVELLVTIPSVVYGLWAINALRPLMADPVDPAINDTLGQIPGIGALFSGVTDGRNLLTAGIVLAIMILPTILSISREVITQVPRLQKEGMLAMGATRWEAIRYAILPYALGGIVGGALLGFARAFGETMAVLMIGGNGPTFADHVNISLLQGGATIASKIAGGATEASSPLGFSAVIELGLVLLAVASVFNIIARQFVNRIHILGT